MYKFEEHKKLAEFIEEMAHTGKAPSEWTKFIEELNIALTIPVVIRRSGQFVCGNCYNTHTNKKYDGYCSQSCFDGIK